MVITNIEKFKNSLFSVYADGQFFGNFNKNFLEISKLCIGKEISEEDLRKVLFESDLKCAKEKAFNILEKRDHSKFELVSKLKKDFNEDVAVKVAEKMQELNLIDDVNFAQKFAEELVTTRGFSKYKAKFEMAKKGLDKNLIAEVLENFEVDEVQRIKELVEKKYKLAYEDEKVKRRAVAYLQRQGYKFDNIKQVIWHNDYYC